MGKSYYRLALFFEPFYDQRSMKSIVLLFLSFCTLGVSAMRLSEPKSPRKFDETKTYLVEIQTDKGKIVCELYPQKAPFSVTNFLYLAENNFYDGLTFHRVVDGFVIQGGDPEGTGQGGPGYTIPAEIGLPHTEGALAWARLPDQINPEKRSSGSQFYITLEETPFLNNDYTVFGQTIEGIDITKKIQKGDKIKKITLSVL